LAVLSSQPRGSSRKRLRRLLQRERERERAELNKRRRTSAARYRQAGVLSISVVNLIVKINLLLVKINSRARRFWRSWRRRRKRRRRKGGGSHALRGGLLHLRVRAASWSRKLTTPQACT
jgi:hypothetical protein